MAARNGAPASAFRALPRLFSYWLRSPQPWCTAIAALFALAASTPWLAGLFEWRRVAHGMEVWRLVTAHFSHWSAGHLAWNLMVFVVFGSILEGHRRRDFTRVVLASGLTLGLTLPILYPEMTAYRGLSGIDCALATAVATVSLQRKPFVDRAAGAAILCFVVLKIAIEFATSQTFFVGAAGQAFVGLPWAHAIGAASGGLLVVVRRRPRDRHRSVPCLDFFGLPHGRASRPRRSRSEWMSEQRHRREEKSSEMAREASRIRSREATRP